MRILLIGNCHTAGLAPSLEVATGYTVAIARYHSGLKEDKETLKELCDGIDAADVVGVISTFAQEVGDLVGATRAEKLQPVPHVRASAFHPDMVHLSIEGERLHGAMGVSHSALIVYGYLNGLSEAETRSLFNARIFAHLKYFNAWQADLAWARRQQKISGFPMIDLYEKWQREGCFLLTPNHPKLEVFSDLAVTFARQNDLPVRYSKPAELLKDMASWQEIWPVYPEIAQQFGIEGGYFFKIPVRGTQRKGNTYPFISLEEFISSSYSTYQQHDLSSVVDNIAQLSRETFQTLSGSRAYQDSLARAGQGGGTDVQNPYKDLPDYNFWKRAVAQPATAEVDPVVSGKFTIGQSDRVATSGSCFAQHISRTLVARGFNYFVPEQAPAGMSGQDADARQFGTFSARFGNIYTTRQLLQLFDRAYGTFVPDTPNLQLENGRYADPFRPFVEPDGFADEAALIAAREEHFAAIRDMFENLDVMVFTLGLTETWVSKSDGAALPIVPSAVTPVIEPDAYEFCNYTAGEVSRDLETFRDRLKAVNPKARIILTVSPVPLIATYEDRHVLVSTTYSKSALRVAAEEMDKTYADVMYFPSYEIITGHYNHGAYYENDLRSVKSEGVDHVMRLFVKHCAQSDAISAYDMADAKLVCDEERLEA